MISILLILIFISLQLSAYQISQPMFSKLSTNEIIKATKSEGYMIVFPQNKNFACFHNNTISCQRLYFHFKTKDTSLASQFFISKDVTNETEFRVTWPQNIEDGLFEKGWLYFNTTSCLRNIWKPIFECSIELTGVEEGKLAQHSPFLAVSSNSQNQIRSKRMAGMSTCTLKERWVWTADLGSGEAQIPSINVGLCVGECLIDHATPLGSVYQKTMYLSFKRNKTHIPNESWKPSCQITGMRSINLFFNRTVGNETLYEEKLFKNMIVTSCGCRQSNCFIGNLKP